MYRAFFWGNNFSNVFYSLPEDVAVYFQIQYPLVHNIHCSNLSTILLHQLCKKNWIFAILILTYMTHFEEEKKG